MLLAMHRSNDHASKPRGPTRVPADRFAREIAAFLMPSYATRSRRLNAKPLGRFYGCRGTLSANVLSDPHAFVGETMLLEKSRIPAGHNVVNMFVLIKGGADRFITFVEDVIGGTERAEVRTPDKDGTLIHAEIQLGDSTLMLADSKPSWPYTPAFIQVYVQDAQVVLDKAQQAGAEVVTEVSDFYNGFRLARMKDPWGNIWWLYEPDHKKQITEPKSDVSWHDKSPSQIYTTLMNAMEHLSGK